MEDIKETMMTDRNLIMVTGTEMTSKEEIGTDLRAEDSKEVLKEVTLGMTKERKICRDSLLVTLATLLMSIS